MEIVREYLIQKGFVIQDKTGSYTSFTYSFIIEGFAHYKVMITSYNNWVFRIETEKKSLSNVVVGFANHTCFLGLISSENPIQILEMLFNCTGVISILENDNIDKLFLNEK